MLKIFWPYDKNTLHTLKIYMIEFSSLFKELKPLVVKKNPATIII